MKKAWFLFILAAALLLTACSGSGQSPVKTATKTARPPATATPAPTALPTATITPIPGGCEVIDLLPQPGPTFPDVTESDWVRGSKDAIVTLIVYDDFQCPYCAQMHPMLEEVMAKFPQDVRVVIRHFPLNIHDKSIISAQATEAAGLQGKFWEMSALLTTRQSEWTGKSVAEFTTWINEQAKTITGLDAAKFSQDLNSNAIINKVQAALTAAEMMGLNQTPTIYLNGSEFGGDPNVNNITEVLKLFKQVTTVIGPIRSTTCPPQVIDATKTYTATITTTKGDVVIKLYADKAPLAVNSFVYLAKRGWFDNTPFHRVIADFVAQTGDPSGTGLGNPGYQYNDEINASLKFDKEGVVGIANSGPNTNGSQIFFTYSAQPQLDGYYTIFGQVTSGMDVLRKLTELDPQFGDTSAIVPDKILKVTISEQ